MQNTAELIPQHKIDKQKWDACVAAASHSNIFMYSWALDALCDDWSGWVVNDYEAVMPLPWRRKTVLKYVYQVPFLPRLSFMSSKDSPADTGLLQKMLKRNFRLVHTDVDNVSLPPKWILARRVNYVLSLAPSYEEISTLKYSPSCRKNIHKAVARHCTAGAALTVTDVVRLYDEAYGSLQATHSKRDYSAVIQFAETVFSKGMASICSVESSVTGDVFFGAIVLQEKGRLYYWLGAPTAAGRAARATYYFIDQLIHQYAATDTLLDFEGSDIPSVADFYRQFGPQAEMYDEVKKINLL